MERVEGRKGGVTGDKGEKKKKEWGGKRAMGK